MIKYVTRHTKGAISRACTSVPQNYENMAAAMVQRSLQAGAWSSSPRFIYLMMYNARQPRPALQRRLARRACVGSYQRCYKPLLSPQVSGSHVPYS